MGDVYDLNPPSGWYDDFDRANGKAPRAEYVPGKIGDIFAASLERVERRCDGREKPIPLPWPVLDDHFGGGLWPGLHLFASGTGTGKTQLGLALAVHAVRQGIPALYIGLELGTLDLSLRLLGEEAHVPWSSLWTGKAGPAYVQKVREAVPRLEDLPFHYEVGRPHGFPPSAIRESVEGMRLTYPETDGPGSRPFLVIVDFLQIVGDEEGESEDIRLRIGRASYVLRELASRLGVAILCISSVARERYKLLNEIQTQADLAWDTDEDDCPIKRRIMNTDAIVGAGKESGELEYSADSVSVLARVAGTWDGTGCDVVFATAKGRATGAMWSPLHFTGFGYRECSDRGGRILEAWKADGEKREEARAEKKAAKEQAAADAVQKDADAVRAFVAKNPGCSVRDARSVVDDQHRRWTRAKERLGDVLIETKVGAQKLQLSLREDES